MARRMPRSDDVVGVEEEDEDRLSALPDDLLRLILDRLDTRTALSTAVLSTRWARLPRRLHALHLRVTDVLPRRYHRAAAAAAAAQKRKRKRKLELELELDDDTTTSLIARCERRAMRAFSDGISGLLTQKSDGGEDDDRRRCAKRLCLEFFATDDDDTSSSCVDRLIPTAVATWGVEDLEIIAKPPLLVVNNHTSYYTYTFPHHLLDDELHRRRLRSLTLSNCTSVPPLYRYGALARLVLRDMPATTPMATYQKLFAARSPLEVLHLHSCRCSDSDDHRRRRRRLVISASAADSRLKELVVADCSFLAIELRTVPALERLACLSSGAGAGAVVVPELRFGAAVPRLAHVNLAFGGGSGGHGHHGLGCFLENARTVGSLVVRFTGPERWILPRPLETDSLYGLRQLLVADVPASWDVTWPRLLLQAAPALEVMHIHVANVVAGAPAAAAGREISWEWQERRRRRRSFRHRRLREVVLAGFQPTLRQISFVRYLARVCTSLDRVALLSKDWQVREVGLWGWEIVPPPPPGKEKECPWSEEDKMVVRRQVRYGRSWCRPLLQVILE